MNKKYQKKNNKPKGNEQFEKQEKYQYAPLPDRAFTVMNDCLVAMFGLSIAYVLSNISSWCYTAEKKRMKNGGYVGDGKGYAVFTNSEWIKILGGAFKKTWTYKLLKDISKLSFVETKTFKKEGEDIIGYRINKKRLEAYLFFNDGKTDISKLQITDVPDCRDLVENKKESCFGTTSNCGTYDCKYLDYCAELYNLIQKRKSSNVSK